MYSVSLLLTVQRSAALTQSAQRPKNDQRNLLIHETSSDGDYAKSAYASNERIFCMEVNILRIGMM
jgi:hypothetical protein